MRPREERVIIILDVGLTREKNIGDGFLVI